MINIMFAGNYKVFDGILMASLSIVKHCFDPISVYILTMDLTEQKADYKSLTDKQIKCIGDVFRSVNDNSCVVKVDVRDVYMQELGVSPNKESQYTPYALLRLLADKIDIIPDKILYLDTDVMLNGNIKILYDIDVNNYEIAGVRDYYGKFFFYPSYLNSGVLLMNMHKIRLSGMLNKALKLCSRKKVFLPDQTAINRYAKRKLILQSKYNEQKNMSDDTLIRHFSTTLKFFPKFKKINIKPWNIEDVHNVLNIHHFDDTYEKYREIINKEFVDLPN
jgi:lipopolysaccharide biosynthesis glycosyltransferase